MNTGINGNLNNPTGQTNPGSGWDSSKLAAAISLHVKSLVVTVFWAVVGFAALAAAYIAYRGILWAAQKVLRALGV